MLRARCCGWLRARAPGRAKRSRRVPQWDDDTLAKAAAKGHTATVAELVRLGANPNAWNEVRLPLVARAGAATAHGHVAGTGGRVSQKLDETPLTSAVGNGHAATAAALVRLGAKVDAKTKVNPRSSTAATRARDADHDTVLRGPRDTLLSWARRC